MLFILGKEGGGGGGGGGGERICKSYALITTVCLTVSNSPNPLVFTIGYANMESLNACNELCRNTSQPRITIVNAGKLTFRALALLRHRYLLKLWSLKYNSP